MNTNTSGDLNESRNTYFNREGRDSASFQNYAVRSDRKLISLTCFRTTDSNVPATADHTFVPGRSSLCFAPPSPMVHRDLANSAVISHNTDQIMHNKGLSERIS